MKNKTIRIACLQLEAMPYVRQSENRKKILQLIEQAAKSNPDLIILPECAYPCYFLSSRIIDDYQTLSAITEQFLSEIKDYAKRFQAFIAIGLPEYIKEKNILYNSAFLIDDQGEEIGRTRKSFLWHFDNIWFQSNDQYPVFDTKIGKIGIFICADGRLPEIARCLALQGAELLLDLTNLVTNGLEKKLWSNPQIDYMLPTRALENKVWIVAANKVGIEEKTIQYCGRSSIFSPEGKTIAMASSDREDILIKDIMLSKSHDKKIGNSINVFKHRKPSKYKTLTLSSSKLAFLSDKSRKSDNNSQYPFAAIIQTEEASDTENYLQKIEYFFQILKTQEVNIFSFSQNIEIPENQRQYILDVLKTLTKEKTVLCSIVLNEQENNKKYKTIFLLESGKIIAQYRKTHLQFNEKDKINASEDSYEVYETSHGRIGMMLDYEGYFPEIARILTLKGAQIIIWPCQFSHDEQLKICQTRSAENKIFIICPNSISDIYNGHSVITSPNGQIITGCLRNSEMASMTKISINLANDKTIVPYTDAVFGRQPESYHLLTAGENI
jgi:predicted amidohydrolase